MWYSYSEWLLIIAAAIIIDWVVGDPKWPTHPVILIGKWIKFAKAKLYRKDREDHARSLFTRGCILMMSTLILVGALTYGMQLLLHYIHTWLGYLFSAWMISTTIAVKGLKEAGQLVYSPLVKGNMEQARQYVGYIVGRETSDMDESEITRATVETIAENIVDAFVAPIFWAIIGGTPFALVYRACNTLDSMVGYRNERYIYFGKSSARMDDILNYIPARLTGMLIVLSALCIPKLKSRRALKSILKFAHLHLSPNSGIPEAGVAGAIGIQLGGRNRYFGKWQDRAVMGWAQRKLEPNDINRASQILVAVSILVLVGVCITWLIINAMN